MKRPFSFIRTGAALVLIGMAANAARAEDASSGAHSFQVGSYTEIKLDGEEASLSQLKIGMQAFVTPDSFQDGYAAMIDAHVSLHRESDAAAPPAAATAPAKTGAKAAAPVSARQWMITAVTANTITVTLK